MVVSWGLSVVCSCKKTIRCKACLIPGPPWLQPSHKTGHQATLCQCSLLTSAGKNDLGAFFPLSACVKNIRHSGGIRAIGAQERPPLAADTLLGSPSFPISFQACACALRKTNSGENRAVLFTRIPCPVKKKTSAPARSSADHHGACVESYANARCGGVQQLSTGSV